MNYINKIHEKDSRILKISVLKHFIISVIFVLWAFCQVYLLDLFVLLVYDTFNLPAALM